MPLSCSSSTGARSLVGSSSMSVVGTRKPAPIAGTTRAGATLTVRWAALVSTMVGSGAGGEGAAARGERAAISTGVEEPLGVSALRVAATRGEGVAISSAASSALMAASRGACTTGAHSPSSPAATILGPGSVSALVASLRPRRGRGWASTGGPGAPPPSCTGAATSSAGGSERSKSGGGRPSPAETAISMLRRSASPRSSSVSAAMIASSTEGLPMRGAVTLRASSSRFLSISRAVAQAPRSVRIHSAVRSTRRDQGALDALHPLDEGEGGAPDEDERDDGEPDEVRADR